MKLRKAVLLILICLFLLLRFKRSHCGKMENTSFLKNNDTILIKLCDDKNTCAYMNFSDNTAEMHLKKHEFVITKDHTSTYKDKYLHYNEPLNLYFLENKKKKWFTVDINGNLISKNSVSKNDRQQFFLKPSTQNQKNGEVIDSNYAVYIYSECGLFDCKAVILDGIKYKDIKDIQEIVASNFTLDKSLDGIPFHVAHT